MAPASVRGGFKDFFVLNGVKWYGCSSDQDGLYYYYAVQTGSVFSRMLPDGLAAGLMFLAAYAVLAFILLIGHTEKRIDASGVQVVDDHDWTVWENGEKEGKRITVWWSRKTPEQKAWFALMVWLGICLAGLVWAFVSSRTLTGDLAIIPYVLSDGWAKGFNLFALTRIVLLLLGIMIVLLGLKVLLSLLYGMLETKGETICRLIGSLVRYALIVAGLFYALEALGFDTTALLASLGIFSLAISLGAKDLVADVLSGIGIVFSGEYQIGDIVEIAGFRGRVWEIGVRSTTLVNTDGNIKNISNRNVSNVMNLTRINSRYTMRVSIPNTQPVEKVMEMLKQELPPLGKGIEEIVAGPELLGISAIDAGKITLSISAEYQEQNLDAVRSKLNLAVKQLFDRHQIPIL